MNHQRLDRFERWAEALLRGSEKRRPVNPRVRLGVALVWILELTAEVRRLRKERKELTTDQDVG